MCPAHARLLHVTSRVLLAAWLACTSDIPVARVTV